MATKKASRKNQTLLEKVEKKASHIKDEIIDGKDHLIEIAGDAITSIKSKIKQITQKKKAVKRKPIKRTSKKAAPKKAPVKKSKKATPKKAIKKTTRKKSAPKKAGKKR